MSDDPFALYALPIGLSEGVEIPLAGTEAVFKVMLPGTMNEEFNMDLMASLSSILDSDGNVRVDGVEFQRKRRDLFFDRCILGSSGLPDNMTTDEFFKKYPLAKRAIYDRATELAVKADEEANVALGKSESLRNGKFSGEGSKSNTKISSKAAST